MNDTRTLIKKILVSGRIITLTGLHIGGSNTSIAIGGVDSSVIRNPLDNKPIIPGSSLKGKMRSLLEQLDGVFGRGVGRNSNHGPTDDPTNRIAKVFGTAVNETNNVPSKVIVRDCELLDAENEILDNQNTDLPYSEIKTEVVIDRITAAATPRNLERVPAGVEFSFDMVINVFDNDDEEKMVNMVFNGLKLLQDDYLGGSGSRGSGQIKFVIEEVKERSREYYIENESKAEIPYAIVELPEELK
ncbi:MAG TPA: type III-A CRISPR-associated RAMP protein Csm3 [Microscillaceae bacterium]|nr:type III-A CRISPR-associated RAMP protein Csm3 [Microscillaceae bacterium]